MVLEKKKNLKIHRYENTPFALKYIVVKQNNIGSYSYPFNNQYLSKGYVQDYIK